MSLTEEHRRIIQEQIRAAYDKGHEHGGSEGSYEGRLVAIERGNYLFSLLCALDTVTSKRIAELEKDAARLNTIASEYLTVEPFDRPTGGDDADVGWRVMQSHMDEHKPRVLAEVFCDDVREAIDTAKLRA